MSAELSSTCREMISKHIQKSVNGKGMKINRLIYVTDVGNIETDICLGHQIKHTD